MPTHRAPGVRSAATPARRRGRTGALPAGLAALALLAVPISARALTPFQFDKQEDVPRSVWSRSVQAGMSLNGGNAPSSGVAAEASLGWSNRRRRVQAGGSLAVARTRVSVAREENGIPGIGPGELHEETQTTRQAWSLHSRYDLFATRHSSAYLSAAGGGDRPAGKRLVLSGQVGWGVDVLHADKQVLRLELGYDLSREEPVVGRTLEIHSARLFLGYKAELDERLSLAVEGEALTNLNAEPAAGERIHRFQDTRLLGRVTATHRINGSLSVCLKLTAAYDHAPPLRPPPAGASFEPGFAPPAKRLDTTADLLLRAVF